MHYYFDNGKVFVDKIAALEYQGSSGSECRLYYHDDQYSKLKWEEEPPGDLDFHYRMQAERLRSQYDYLILCYSGGVDSTNILETFYYNNIKLDKIVVVGALSQDIRSGVDHNHNGELYHNCFPLIDQLGLSKLVQVVDYAPYFDDMGKNFSIYQQGNNWVNLVGSHLSPTHYFWHDLHEFVVPYSWRDRKVGIIFGSDKPIINVNVNPWSFQFLDTKVMSYGNRCSGDYFQRINFYWDPDYPLLLLKQLHVVKSVLLSDQQRFKYYRTRPIDQEVLLGKIIYRLRNPLYFRSAKSSLNFSLRDSFLRDKPNSSVMEFYRLGMDFINSKGIKLRPISSKPYYFL